MSVYRTRDIDILGSPLPETIQTLIKQHHTIYPLLPPQGIFFEALAQRAFHLCGAPDARIVKTSPNLPQYDLQVGEERISIKTETGKSTKPTFITITKLCTTEKEPWAAEVLVQRVMQHLSRYDRVMMLRAIWPAREDLIHYQLLEVPVELLRLIRGAEFGRVGTRRGRKSLGADVFARDERVFHVHFDGADGKCQITRLLVSRCRMLAEWDQRVDQV